jgi:hypothetical protein
VAIPKPKPSDWQIANAQELQVTDKQVLEMLRAAKKRVDSILAELPAGKQEVKRAQLESTRARLLAQQADVFERLGDIVSARRARAASRSAGLSAAADKALLDAVGRGAEGQFLYESALQVGQRQIDAAMARMRLSQLPLSKRIYNTQVWMQGRLGKLINETLATGLNAKEFARRARDWFNPNTPGGVRYAAMRLARTEINNAFHAMTAEKAARDPWIKQVDWNLSKSHPKPDICNEVHADSPFPSDKVPARPHPQCMCYITPKAIDEDEFIDNFLKGDYNDFLDKELAAAGWAPEDQESTPKSTMELLSQPVPQVVLTGPLHVMDRFNSVFAQGWQKQSDPELRAGGLWSESFFGLSAVRNGIRNIRAGRDPLEDTKLSRGRYDIFRDEDADGSSIYTEDDFRNDVISAAGIWEEKIHNAPLHGKLLYRGLRLPSDRMFTVGEIFTQDISSWTEDRDWASVYANKEDSSTGHIGDIAVIIKLVGKKHSADIDDIVGSSQHGSKEHIASGSYRVRKITGRGKKFTVEVEEI